MVEKLDKINVLLRTDSFTADYMRSGPSKFLNRIYEKSHSTGTFTISKVNWQICGKKLLNLLKSKRAIEEISINVFTPLYICQLI
jgi:hypothetical protein